MNIGQSCRRWAAICAALVVSLSVAFGGQDGAYGRQEVPKSVKVVPRSGPLQGQTVYTGTYALFVGIGSYAASGIPDIPSAPHDAKTIRDLLVEKFGFDKNPDHTVVLTDQQATRARIEAELARLCVAGRVQKTDRVFVFFSCHGQSIKTLDGDDHGYLLPYDAQVNLADINDPAPYQNTCIKMDDMVGKLAECPANHRVVVLDACFSGLAVHKDLPAPFDPGVVQDDLKERGLYVLTAGTAKEETFGVNDPEGLSIFTRAFVETLKDCALHGNTAFIEQIAFDAAERTFNASKGRQRPTPLPKTGVGSMLFFPTQGTSEDPAPPPLAPKILSAILQVTSTPSGANVLVDGKAVGKTPLSLPVDLITETSKSVEVAVQLDGYLAAGQTLTLTRGATVPFNASLVAVAAPSPTVTPRAGGRRLSAKGEIEMVLIPEGEFTMGSNVNDNEKPQRKVFLDAYTIGKTPVTVGQFKAYCKDVGIHFGMFPAPPWGWKDDHPMVNVNWEQARAFCKWAGGDLPTEAQWEKAARGTEGREFPWGNEFDANRLWCSKSEFGDAKSTAPVGSFPAGASPYGCLDMAGNVWQWCLDWYAPSYSGQPDRNPTGPGFATDRVLRGGPWDDYDPQLFRSAYRWTRVPSEQYIDFGFRLAGPP